MIHERVKLDSYFEREIMSLSRRFGVSASLVNNVMIKVKRVTKKEELRYSCFLQSTDQFGTCYESAYSFAAIRFVDGERLHVQNCKLAYGSSITNVGFDLS